MEILDNQIAVDILNRIIDLANYSLIIGVSIAIVISAMKGRRRYKLTKDKYT